MKTLFLQNMAYEALGPMFLSSALRRAGHETSIRVAALERDVVSAVRDEAPDLVAMSVLSGSHWWELAWARKLGAAGFKVVIGGPHPTFFPETAESPGVFAACRGEGEAPLIELARRLKAGLDYLDTPGFWFRTGDGEIRKNPLGVFESDLDRLPFPDRSFYERYPFLAREPTKHFITGRGCPYNCSFCYNSRLRALTGADDHVRRHSVDWCMEEITQTIGRWPTRTLFFQDDTFTHNKPWIMEFCEEYGRRVGKPFVCTTRATELDADIVAAVAAAGCHCIILGVESGVERLRNRILNKALSDERIREAAALLRKHKILFRTTNMMGFPGEEFEDAVRTIEFNADIKAPLGVYSVFQPYPGTGLFDDALAQGRLAPGFSVDDIGQNFFLRSALEGGDAKRIENLQKFAVLGASLPFLMPLIRLLTKLPANPVFDLVFKIFFLTHFRKCANLSLFEALARGIKLNRHFVTPKQ